MRVLGLAGGGRRGRGGAGGVASGAGGPAAPAAAAAAVADAAGGPREARGAKGQLGAGVRAGPCQGCACAQSSVGPRALALGARRVQRTRGGRLQQGPPLRQRRREQGSWKEAVVHGSAVCKGRGGVVRVAAWGVRSRGTAMELARVCMCMASAPGRCAALAGHACRPTHAPGELLLARCWAGAVAAAQVRGRGLTGPAALQAVGC